MFTNWLGISEGYNSRMQVMRPHWVADGVFAAAPELDEEALRQRRGSGRDEVARQELHVPDVRAPALQGTG